MPVNNPFQKAPLPKPARPFNAAQDVSQPPAPVASPGSSAAAPASNLSPSWSFLAATQPAAPLPSTAAPTSSANTQTPQLLATKDVGSAIGPMDRLRASTKPINILKPAPGLNASAFAKMAQLPPPQGSTLFPASQLPTAVTPALPTETPALLKPLSPALFGGRGGAPVRPVPAVVGGRGGSPPPRPAGPTSTAEENAIRDDAAAKARMAAQAGNSDKVIGQMQQEFANQGAARAEQRPVQIPGAQPDDVRSREPSFQAAWRRQLMDDPTTQSAVNNAYNYTGTGAVVNTGSRVASSLTPGQAWGNRAPDYANFGIADQGLPTIREDPLSVLGDTAGAIMAPVGVAAAPAAAAGGMFGAAAATTGVDESVRRDWMSPETGEVAKPLAALVGGGLGASAPSIGRKLFTNPGPKLGANSGVTAIKPLTGVKSTPLSPAGYSEEVEGFLHKLHPSDRLPPRQQFSAGSPVTSTSGQIREAATIQAGGRLSPGGFLEAESAGYPGHRPTDRLRLRRGASEPVNVGPAQGSWPPAGADPSAGRNPLFGATLKSEQPWSAKNISDRWQALRANPRAEAGNAIRDVVNFPGTAADVLRSWSQGSGVGPAAGRAAAKALDIGTWPIRQLGGTEQLSRLAGAVRGGTPYAAEVPAATTWPGWGLQNARAAAPTVVGLMSGRDPLHSMMPGVGAAENIYDTIRGNLGWQDVTDPPSREHPHGYTHQESGLLRSHTEPYRLLSDRFVSPAVKALQERGIPAMLAAGGKAVYRGARTAFTGAEASASTAGGLPPLLGSDPKSLNGATLTSTDEPGRAGGHFSDPGKMTDPNSLNGATLTSAEQQVQPLEGLKPEHLGFKDESEMLAHLDDKADGLGTRWSSARQAYAALGGDDKDKEPAPGSPEHAAWQAAKTEYMPLQRQADAVKMQHFKQTQMPQIKSMLREVAEASNPNADRRLDGDTDGPFRGQLRPSRNADYEGLRAQAAPAVAALNGYAADLLKAKLGNPDVTPKDLSSALQHDDVIAQQTADVQRNLAGLPGADGAPVPRYAARAILNEMDESSRMLLYAGLGLTAIAALGHLFGFGEGWAPLLAMAGMGMAGYGGYRFHNEAERQGQGGGLFGSSLWKALAGDASKLTGIGGRQNPSNPVTPAQTAQGASAAATNPAAPQGLESIDSKVLASSSRYLGVGEDVVQKAMTGDRKSKDALGMAAYNKLNDPGFAAWAQSIPAPARQSMVADIRQQAAALPKFLGVNPKATEMNRLASALEGR